MTEESTVPLLPTRGRDWLLAMLALLVGASAAWMALLAALYLPTDRPTVWLGVPTLTVGAVALAVSRRSRRWGLLLAVSGALALVFFAWLFWQLGQGMQNFD